MYNSVNQWIGAVDELEGLTLQRPKKQTARRGGVGGGEKKTFTLVNNTTIYNHIALHTHSSHQLHARNIAAQPRPKKKSAVRKNFLTLGRRRCDGRCGGLRPFGGELRRVQWGDGGWGGRGCWCGCGVLVWGCGVVGLLRTVPAKRSLSMVLISEVMLGVVGLAACGCLGFDCSLHDVGGRSLWVRGRG